MNKVHASIQKGLAQDRIKQSDLVGKTINIQVNATEACFICMQDIPGTKNGNVAKHGVIKQFS